MPVAKIHVHEGAFKDGELAAIGTAVQAALEEVLSVPPEDYFRIMHVLPKGQFVHTPAFVGRTYSDSLRPPRTDLHLRSPEGEAPRVARCAEPGSSWKRPT
jgi:hypothetical protein